MSREELLDRIVFHAREGAYGRILRGEQTEVYITPGEWNPSVLHLIKMHDEIERGECDGKCILEVQNWEEDGKEEDTKWYIGKVVTEFPRDYHPEWGCPNGRCWVIELENELGCEPMNTKKRKLKLIGDVIDIVPPRVRVKSVEGDGILK